MSEQNGDENGHGQEIVSSETPTEATRNWGDKAKKTATLTAAGIIGVGSAAAIGTALPDLWNWQTQLPSGVIKWTAGWMGLTYALDLKSGVDGYPRLLGKIKSDKK